MLMVGDWLAHWLVSRTSPGASTVRGYAAHVRLYLVPYLEQILLADLSAAHVQAKFTASERSRWPQRASGGQPRRCALPVRLDSRG